MKSMPGDTIIGSAGVPSVKYRIGQPAIYAEIEGLSNRLDHERERVETLLKTVSHMANQCREPSRTDELEPGLDHVTGIFDDQPEDDA